MLAMPSLENFCNLSKEEQIDLIQIAEAQAEYIKGNFIDSLYPEEGPLRRELYAKHMEFFEKGAEYSERCFMAANRVGKTLGGGGYELTLHLTGQYPKWWKGYRFKKPIKAWAAGKTNETTRDIIQLELMGERKNIGTGLIRRDCIGDFRWKSGVADLLDTVKVKHKSGGWSTLGLKSYQQGRDGFEGTAKHVIWLDEEPPRTIYEECVLRTMTTKGLIMLTFTPLVGMSDTVRSFMPKEYQFDGD